MEPFQEYTGEYRRQMEKGHIKKVYKGLMEYIAGLRLHLKNKYPDYFVSGGVQHGLMDFTYFYFFPKSLKKRNLKVAILFVHDTFRFEVLLAGYNRTIQKSCWELFKRSGWNKYHLAPTAKGVDYIVDTVLVDSPDFSSPDVLTEIIETGALDFIRNVEDFLSGR